MATLAVPGSPGPSSRARTNSVLSVSSELTDPEELVNNTSKSREGSSSGLSEVSDEDDQETEDDDIMEVNADGSAKGATRIRDLLNHPPKEPKHRWETAVCRAPYNYVYAFIERFTTVQEDSAHAPQTILEFEHALQHGCAPVMPETTDEDWAPSLAPVLHDFVDRGKRTHREAGGSGGMSGKWQVWLPWWVEEQRSLGNADFQQYHWRDTIKTMKEKDEEYKFFSLPWEKQLAVMKALVDYQVCLSGEIIKTINASYGHETAGELAKKAKERKEQREKEQKEKEAEQPAETKKEAAANDKGKAPEKPKQTRAPRGQPQDVQNTLAITSIGTDSRKHVWYRIDDSPRLYVNSNPIAANQTFVAVADSLEDVKMVLQGLISGPTTQAGKANDPFSKALKGKGKLAPKDQREDNEKKLHKKITSIINALSSEETGYEARMDTLRTRRRVLIEKREKKRRAEALAAARAADLAANVQVHGTRSSRRLRRGNRDSAGYNEAAGDDELEQALRASEREARKRRRLEGSSDSDDSSSGSEAGFNYGGMDIENDDEEDYDVEMEDDSQENRRSRRSNRAAMTDGKGKPAIPGERRSTRVRQSRRNSSRESSEEPPVRGGSRRQAAIVRSYSEEEESDSEEDEDGKHPFDGLEEVWSKGKYTGYFTVDRKFIPAKPGDIPLYKLTRMGLPMPTEHGGAPDANVSAESSVPGSAVPTLELDNGNSSDEQSAKQEDGEENSDSDADVVVVASRQAPPKKRIKSSSPEMEVTSVRAPNGHASKSSATAKDSQMEIVSD